MEHFTLLKTSPSFGATLNKFMMFASWSLLSFPYINMSSWIASTPGHCATMSSIHIWKMSWLILSPNGTCRNLYLPRCVLNVVNNDASSVRCIQRKLCCCPLWRIWWLLWGYVWSPQGLELYDSLEWWLYLGPLGQDIFLTCCLLFWDKSMNWPMVSAQSV